MDRKEDTKRVFVYNPSTNKVTQTVSKQLVYVMNREEVESSIAATKNGMRNIKMQQAQLRKDTVELKDILSKYKMALGKFRTVSPVVGKKEGVDKSADGKGTKR
jgi:hypothetical protein